MPADYRRRQTMKNAERFITPELKAFEDKALAAGERALAREKELYEALLGAPAGSPRPPAAKSPGRRLRTRRPGRSGGLPPRRFVLTRPAFTGEDVIEIARRPAPRRREPGRGLHRQRHEPLAFAPAPAHHRPEHGRQVHLHAPGGADRAARALRLVRARRRGDARARSTASSRASAPPTTSPAGARPSWWR